jgi:GDPmannose 4,6-dehydratase
MEAAWRMLQHPEPGDFVVATGKTHSVRELLQAAFTRLDLDWQDFVRVDSNYFRPTEVDSLQGDPSKVWNALGWAAKVKFEELVRIMVDADLELAQREAHGQEFRP